MSRRLDIGVVSYKNPERLLETLKAILSMSRTDWRCFIIHNPADGSEDAEARRVIEEMALRSPRFVPIFAEANGGYAGGVNELLLRSETEYIAYLDNDAYVQTEGWDDLLASYLDRFHEIGLIFPNGGAYPIDRGSYSEIMWGVGFCWMINRLAMKDAGVFDQTLGHQEEADYSLRVRMAGWKCAAAREVHVRHHATATNSPSQLERINRGVVNWVNKWNRYFNGVGFNYHSPNVTRWEDWPPNALYLEEYWRARLPELNKEPEVVNLEGRAYDLIRVPRLSGFYRNRII